MRLAPLFWLLLLAGVAMGPPARAEWLPSGSPEPSAERLQQRAENLQRHREAPTTNTIRVPLAVHLIRNDDGEDGLSLEQLRIGLDDLNQRFEPIGVEFYALDPIDFIEDTDWLWNIDGWQEVFDLAALRPTPGAIDVYFPYKVETECGSKVGAAIWPDGIVCRVSCVGRPSEPSVLSGLMGDWFGLLSTQSIRYGRELVDGSNCAVAGDLLCDTPADPGMFLQVDTDCFYFGGAIDPNGDPYDPDTGNLMGEARASCRDHFSPQQQEILRGQIEAEFSLPGPVATADRSLLLVRGGLPNPFRSRTIVEYALSSVQPLEAAVYDARGRRVRCLLSSAHAPGLHWVEWDGRDDEGRELPQGVYHLRLATPVATKATKLLLLH